MHTVDLTGDDAPAAAKASKAVATKQSSEIATLSSGTGVHGEVGMRDMTIPYLAIVQKSGTKADTHQVGSWVVGENQVAEKDTPLEVAAWDIQKRYETVHEFGSGIIPQIFETAEELRKAGFSLTRGSENEAREIAGILFWIYAPKDADEAIFPLVTSGGIRGTVAKFVARSTSYGGVAMPLFTAVSPLGHLRGKHLKDGKWSLSATLTKGNGNTYFKLSLRPKAFTSADVVELVDGLDLV